MNKRQPILLLTAAFVSLSPTHAAAEGILTLDEVQRADLTVTFQSDCAEKSEPDNFHQMQRVPTSKNKFNLYFDPSTIRLGKFGTFFLYTFYIADTGSHAVAWYECTTQVYPHGAFFDRNERAHFTITHNSVVDDNSLDLPVHSIGKREFLEITTQPDPITGKPTPARVNLSKPVGVELLLRNLLLDMDIFVEPTAIVTSSNMDYWEPFSEVRLSDTRRVRIRPSETVVVRLQLTPKRLPALFSTLSSVKPDGVHDKLDVVLSYSSDFGGANRDGRAAVGVRFVPSILNLIFALLSGSLLGTLAAQLLPGVWKGWKTAAERAARGLLFALVAELFAMLLVALGSKFVIIQFDLDPWQFLPVLFIGFIVSGGKEVLSYLGLSRPSDGAATRVGRSVGAPP